MEYGAATAILFCPQLHPYCTPVWCTLSYRCCDQLPHHWANHFDALFEKAKYKKAVALMAGIWDGLRNRYGAFEARWPRVFAFCTGLNAE